MTYRDKAYSLATLLCSAVMVVVAVLLSVDEQHDIALSILGSAVVFCIFLWWVGWRHYVRVDSEGIVFTDDFAPTRRFAWSDVVLVEMERDVLGRFCVIVTLVNGKRYDVEATQRDLLQSLFSKKKNERIAEFVRESERLRRAAIGEVSGE